MRALKYSDMDASFRVNLFSQYFLTAGLIELLGAAAKHGGGRGNVICFSSVAAQHFGQFAPAYQLSKAGVDHMVRTMAAEFAEFYSMVHSPIPQDVQTLTHVQRSPGERYITGLIPQ